jgi:hypothetical protein
VDRSVFGIICEESLKSVKVSFKNVSGFFSGMLGSFECSD